MNNEEKEYIEHEIEENINLISKDNETIISTEINEFTLNYLKNLGIYGIANKPIIINNNLLNFQIKINREEQIYMTNEEKEVIEETKKKIESTQKGLKEGKYYGEQFNLEREIKREQILLNLINKLQKENAELKNMDLTTVYMKGFYDSESKWKEKIKKIITPTPDNPIPIEVQISDMYEKLKKILEK